LRMRQSWSPALTRRPRRRPCPSYRGGRTEIRRPAKWPPVESVRQYRVPTALSSQGSEHGCALHAVAIAL
jgi:hypothetical protein